MVYSNIFLVYIYDAQALEDNIYRVLIHLAIVTICLIGLCFVDGLLVKTFIYFEICALLLINYCGGLMSTLTISFASLFLANNFKLLSFREKFFYTMLTVLAPILSSIALLSRSNNEIKINSLPKLFNI
jgi:hypothetical protein